MEVGRKCGKWCDFSMISVLFVSKNSVYKTLGVDCWDEDRDALKWAGGNSVVAHPPCRLFSALKHMSRAPESEKELAYWALEQVRQWGGVLEHPARSKLWEEKGLPLPGRRDEWGWTLCVSQYWFGHKGEKATWLYIVGIDRKELPPVPLRLGYPVNVFAGSSRRQEPGARHSLRSATPIEFARWLIEVALQCNRQLNYET